MYKLYISKSINYILISLSIRIWNVTMQSLPTVGMVSLSYSSSLPASAPDACLIVGELCNLQKTGYTDVESLIGHRVTAKVSSKSYCKLTAIAIYFIPYRNWHTLQHTIHHPVPLQVYNEVIGEMGESEGVVLYPKHVAVATLSSKHSRHTTPSAAHHIMDTVNKNLPKAGNAVVLVSAAHLHGLYLNVCSLAGSGRFLEVVARGGSLGFRL